MQWLSRSTRQLVETMAIRLPDRNALVEIRHGSSPTLRSTTYSQLAAAVTDGQAHLRGLGVRPGDRVAIWSENSTEWVVAWLAATVLGAKVVAINSRLTAREVAYQLETAKVDLVLIDVPDPRRTKVAEVAESLREHDRISGASMRWLGATDRDPSLCPRWDRSGGIPGRTRSDAPDVDDDVRLIQFTSGSSSEPKAALLRESAVLANAAAVAGRSTLFPDDRVLGALPLFHIGGTVFTVLTSLVAGACVVLTPWDDAISVIDEHGVTVIPGVQTMIADLCAARQPGQRVRLAMLQGPTKFATEASETLGIRVHNTYGLTECSPNVTITDAFEVPGPNMGRPHPGVQVRIVGDDGAVLGPGMVGAIQVRGWNVMTGYLDVAPAAQPIDAEGWLHTGDLGLVDEFGALTFIGRRDDVYKSGGENVSILEVESAITSHPFVHQAAVVPVPDERLGEVAVAFVQLLPERHVSSSELIDHCRNVLAGAKIPKRIVALEVLPQIGSGKVDRRQLLEMATEMSECSGRVRA